MSTPAQDPLSDGRPRFEVDHFRRADQALVRRLILDGLEEHWGSIDPALNPDLDDISASYAEGTVLIARVGPRVVGVAMLVPVGDHEGEVKRMSVASDLRRRGIATALLQELTAAALRRAGEPSDLRRRPTGQTRSSSIWRRGS